MSGGVLKMARIRNIKPDGTTPRFWKEVSVAPVSSFQLPSDVLRGPLRPGCSEEHVVLLDGRGMRTPFDHLFAVPSEPLAHLLALEWQLQGSHVRSESMPLMRLATTAIDIVGTRRPSTVAGLMKYLKHDSLLFRADPETQPELYERQLQLQQPIIEWFQERYGVQVRMQGGLLPEEQSDETRARMEREFAQMDDWRMAAVDQLCGEGKSLLVALMVEAGHLSPEQALQASRAEELYNADRWGRVPAGQDLDMSFSMLMLSSANAFIKALT